VSKGQVHDLSVNDGSETEAGEAVIQVLPILRVYPHDHYGSMHLEYEFSLLSGSVEASERAQRAAGVSDYLEHLSMVSKREIGSLETYASVEEVLEKAHLEKALETWCDLAREKGLTWVWNTGSSWSKVTLIRALLLKTQMKNSFAIWRECPITLKPEATTPSTYHRVTTRPGLAQIPLGQSPDTERLWLYSIIRQTIPSRSDPATDADDDDDQAHGKLHFFAIPTIHPESQAPWAEEYFARFRTEHDSSLESVPRSKGRVVKDLRSLIETCYKWETRVKESAEKFASEFLVEIVPEGAESQPERFIAPAPSRGPD
jgi:hypothetical protein